LLKEQAIFFVFQESAMPEHQHSTSNIKGKVRTRVTLKRGEVIALCRCWHSEHFPLCDGSHKNIKGEHGPVTIRTQCDQDFGVHPNP
jgi:CDGSH-type Zn-finger protein